MKSIISTLLLGIVIFSSCKNANIEEPSYRDIRDIRISKVGPLHTLATMDLIYYNPNNFGVNLTDARGDVYLDDAFLGRFDLAKEISIAKNREFVVPAELKIDMLGLVKNQREIYKKKQVMLRIEGVATLKKAGQVREIPFKHEVMQDIDKFRSLVSK